jgi:hypothetical protein
LPTRQSATALTIGFFGTGAMDVEHGTTLIEEWIDARVKKEDKVRWVFVLTSDEFTQTLADYAASAKDFEIAYEVITKPDDKARRTFNEVGSDAAHIYNVDNPLLQMEQILKEASQSALFILWDDERNEEMERISGQFLDDEIEVYELSDALTPMGYDTDEPAEATVTSIRSQPTEEPEAGDGDLYSRTDLKEMSMQRLKEVAASLGLGPRKSREAMVNEILAAQSGVEEEQEEAETAEEPEPEPSPVAVAAEVTENLDELLDRFSNTFVARMSDVFDTFLTDLAKTVEGIQFNLTPEVPQPETETEEPRRRVVRRGAS